MIVPLDCFWFLDPLPLPPDLAFTSMAYWRWRSRVTLQARAEV